MKIIIAAVLTLLLSGCVAVPIQQKWPSIPKDLEEACPPLLTIQQESVEIVEFMEIVVKNYNLYNNCMIINQGWTKWYNEQKEIYNK